MKPVSLTGPAATVAPAGQVGSGGPPLAVWRTVATHVPVQLTISTGGTSMPADAPANVSVKPVLPAPAELTVPAKPGMALIAAATLLLLTARPPAPSTAEAAPPIWTWNDWVVALKPASVTTCCSLPPMIAFWIPSCVLFSPGTIGAVSAPR